MTPAGFEPAIPDSERSQIHALDGAATAIGLCTEQKQRILPPVLVYKV